MSEATMTLSLTTTEVILDIESKFRLVVKV